MGFVGSVGQGVPTSPFLRQPRVLALRVMVHHANPMRPSVFVTDERHEDAPAG